MKLLKGLMIFVLISDFVLVNIALVILWHRPPQVVNNTQTVAIPTQSPAISPVAATPTVITKTITVVKESVSKPQKNTVYIPIPGTGNTLENKWTDIPGTEFYLSSDDYPNISDARLEANFRLLNGNVQAYVRLFDVTVGIEVWGSEVKTNSQSFTVINSDKLTLRPGNHLYRIQIKSLTADTTIYNSGRLKITYTNE